MFVHQLLRMSWVKKSSSSTLLTSAEIQVYGVSSIGLWACGGEPEFLKNLLRKLTSCYETWYQPLNTDEDVPKDISYFIRRTHGFHPFLCSQEPSHYDSCLVHLPVCLSGGRIRAGLLLRFWRKPVPHVWNQDRLRVCTRETQESGGRSQ